MKNNGFTHLRTEDGVTMLQGDFASYKNCIVGVATLKQKDLVNKITVMFPESKTWSSLACQLNVEKLYEEVRLEL